MSSTWRAPHEGGRSESDFAALSRAVRSFSESSHSLVELRQAVVREVASSVGCHCTLTLVDECGALATTDTSGAPEVAEVGEPLRDSITRTPHVVPLRAQGRVIGALSLSGRGAAASPLGEADVSLVEAIAQSAAGILAAAHFREQAGRDRAERERMAARLRLLADSAHDFSEATGNYDRLLALIARRIGEALGDLCAIRGVSEDGLWLEIGEVYHRDADTVTLIRRMSSSIPQRVGEGITGRVAATGVPLFLPVLAEHEFARTAPPEYREFLENLDVRSVLFVPMECRERVVGVAVLLRSGPERPYTEDDLQLVRSVVHHAAIAIANARSYSAERAARAAAAEAYAAAHQSEAARKLLFDASPTPLLVFDVESLAVLAVNDAGLRLYGYAREELLSSKVTVLTGGREDAVWATSSTMHRAEVSGVAHHVRKDGSELIAEYVTRPLAFAGHDARITSLNDVTARFEAEQARSLLAAIVESANDAIISKRLNGIISSWNPAAERLFGYSAAETIGRHITLLVPTDRLNEEGEVIRQIAAGKTLNSFETVRLRKDGSEVAVSLSIAPIRDGDGKVIGASKTARDLSEQRRAEEALRNTEEQLRQAQKMEAIGRLGGGIAHDFNNLLSVILSYTDLLADDPSLAVQASADLAEIRKAALSASELTRQLLVFSRQQVVLPQVLDLNGLLASTDKMLRRILGEDVDLVSTLAPDLGRVLVDPSNIEQVVINLAVNARDAMPTGGKLTIETRNVVLDTEYSREHFGAQPGPHVMLAVSDTGTGMDRATQARIFEPFFTTKALGKGTGLGLSTVFGIAQQAGGSIWVYSELGKGSTFKVYFPRVEAALHATTPPATAASLHGTETILLVEDQDQVRAVAYGILKRLGYRIIVAQSAAEALLLCEADPAPIHLLLTDVVMPEMSGAELANRLETARPSTRVLFMSGYTDDSVIRHGVLESGVAFLQKPFTPDSLARKVREVLGATSAKLGS